MATVTPGQAAAPTQAAAPSAAPVIADPAPLGLAAFGITTLALSSINAGLIGPASEPMVLALAIAFGGGAQVLAGMWAFRRGNIFAATAFTAYGAFWLSFYLLVNFFVAPIKKAGGVDSVNVAVGMYLFCWGLFTAYMLLASLASPKIIRFVFLVLTLTFFALSLGKWFDSTSLGKLGGYLGIITAVGALYGSCADVVNANFKKTLLPT